MKLSVLKELVAAMEARAYPSNPDPEVQFYIPRVAGMLDRGDKDAHAFVQFDIQIEGDLGQRVHNSQVVSAPSIARCNKGDFDLALGVVPFYN